jgi:hypothetical protein
MLVATCSASVGAADIKSGVTELGETDVDGLRFPVTVHLHGTLAANAQGAFPLPIGMTLEAVAAVAGNDSDAKLQLGTGGDADGIMTAKAIGGSGTPLTFVKTNFDGSQCDARNPPHFAKGTVITWLLDFDGDGGDAAADVTLLFSFLEG